MKFEIPEWLKEIDCPSCHQKGGIRPILRGMPTADAFKSGAWIIGGCLVFGDMAKHGCVSCDWEGNLDIPRIKIIEIPEEHDLNPPEVEELEDIELEPVISED